MKENRFSPRISVIYLLLATWCFAACPGANPGYREDAADNSSRRKDARSSRPDTLASKKDGLVSNPCCDAQRDGNSDATSAEDASTDSIIVADGSTDGPDPDGPSGLEPDTGQNPGTPRTVAFAFNADLGGTREAWVCSSDLCCRRWLPRAGDVRGTFDPPESLATTWRDKGFTGDPPTVGYARDPDKDYYIMSGWFSRRFRGNLDRFDPGVGAETVWRNAGWTINGVPTAAYARDKNMGVWVLSGWQGQRYNPDPDPTVDGEPGKFEDEVDVKPYWENANWSLNGPPTSAWNDGSDVANGQGGIWACRDNECQHWNGTRFATTMTISLVCP